MKARRFALVALASAAFCGSASAVLAQTRAVVELFTSQGCSSCPAADKLLGELMKDPGIVAMSVPIDYWDYLGWKDTLASPAHTARQRGYAKMRGDRQVYTPQVVINGSLHVLGSDKAAIERAIAASRRSTASMSLAVTLMASGDTLSVTIPDGKPERSAEVWLCAITKTVPVEIARGENRGRTVTYHNVARRWQKLGDWTGKAVTWNVPLSDIKAAQGDAAAVLVQSGTVEHPNMTLGAAMASLP
ncbi:MAG TPA: DUF1223 domain-containing protein [Xanthobacteraceae bacterium]|jgi:hypothetical protein